MDRIVNLKKLKEYMERNNISEVQLAKLIGVDYTTVYRVFRGKRKPGAKFIAGLLNGDIDLKYGEIFLTKPLPDGNIKSA